MDWYWYVLIVVAVVGLGALKMIVWNRIKANKVDKEKQNQHRDED